MKNVLLCVTGSIAVYKAAELANRLTKAGYNVDTVMTRSAEEFVTPLTFQTLTGNKVHTAMFELYDIDPQVEHISLGKKADVCIVAPATANIIGKIAAGIADDMVSTVIMALDHAPIYICPAMNTKMYINPIVQKNIKDLSALGYRFIESRESRLACGDVGIGAMANVEDIINTIETYLQGM
ncbi:MAG: flavoprotein [Eubacteriales bacterium]|nr:flavoprotein [Eubacteriales bacterium]MDD3199583.1 flavoprotein [Eubacteriales bacterium]MDD4122642.1 flavoprotein [Eubacteriales bacterium]MDD4629295.1 flavoprotein [Eubacteriales bacterium]